MPARDPWTSFLETLQTFIIPDWNAVIQLLPILLVLGVVGPGLSLLALYWLYWRSTRFAGHVRWAAVEPRAMELEARGEPVVPANTPFCSKHLLLYPQSAKTCDVDGEELSVRCPIDDVTRGAREQVCRACGTRYVLGASDSALVVRRTGQPPKGGAAVA